MSGITHLDLTNSIKAILKDGDLDQLSAKKIRKMLETEFKADLIDRKEEIDKLVMQLITGDSSEEETHAKQTTINGTVKGKTFKQAASPRKEKAKDACGEDLSLSEDEDNDSDNSDSEDPLPKKKRKLEDKNKGGNKFSKKVDEDEELAKQLQEDEGIRPSRRCKAQPVARKPRKQKKEGAKSKGNSVYSRPCVLLPPLDGLFGTDRMPRPMIVKRIWEIVKERDLLDPKNKQFMICDEQMLKIFGRSRVRMFGVMKILKPYIKDLPKE